MHGRLKVKTTEEQQKAKEAERAKKLKLYNAATSKAFQKRKDGELDSELLEITGQVLHSNPDFYTFWNMRKETFLHLRTKMQAEELQKLHRNELDFLEMCLKVNPKSYGTWHHRCFIMDQMPKPDWARELELCNIFLQYDERNFHCWDYRRFVVKRSNVPASEEFDFATCKISSNFSNFSSWHYRSKLLPLLYPDHLQYSGISLEVIQSEFELVQNGLYTDPDDQSNWFYHKWLLGRGDQKLKINYVHISIEQERLLVSFTNAIKIGVDTCDVLLNGSKVDVRWANQTGRSSFSTLWIGEVQGTGLDCLGQGSQDRQVEIQVKQDDGKILQHSVLLSSGNEEASYRWSTANISTWFREQLCGVDKTALHRELETIRELQEVETSNKWAMLTLVLLMKAADPVSYQDQILSLLQQLQNLDVLRATYYQDLRSRFIIETAIETSLDPNVLSLKGQQLATMSCLQLLPLVEELDLSENCLTQLLDFGYLQNLQQLNLANNRLTRCNNLSLLPRLTHLDLSNNFLGTVSCVQPLQSCKRLKSLNLSGNPLCEETCALDKLKEFLPTVEIHLTKTEES